MNRKNAGNEGAERSISAAMRILMVLATLALNFIFILFLSGFLEENATYVYAALSLLSMVLAIRIYNRHESTSYKLLWILLIALAPVAGLILYALLGNTASKKIQGLKDLPLPATRESVRMKSEEELRALRREEPLVGRLANYLARSGFLLYGDTETLYIPDGAQFFDDLLARMEQAEHFIFLEYYIIAEGEIWDRIFRILRKKAKEGVEIKVIFDDLGNITRFSAETLAALRYAGIECTVFNPVHRYVNRMYFNYRDHRKIAVIDGNYAYTGGVNIGDEYAHLLPRFGEWRDSVLRLHGAGVWEMTLHFIHLWERLGGEMREETDYYAPQEEVKGQGRVQCVFDSPVNNPQNPIQDVYLQLIYSAQSFLYITTPYLAMEDHMVDALCAAADGGVDVRLMLPGIPDKKYVYLVSESYLGDLLRHGVKVYRYTPGFLHNKSVMTDRKVALIGSANLDFRSFQINLEDAVLCYGTPAVEELLQDMDDIMDNSECVRMEDWQKRGVFRKLFAALLRIFAVWM